MSGAALLFLATEDWFVRSHFLPLLKRAVADGYRVTVAARDSGVLAGVAGVRVIDTPFARGSLKPWELSRQVAHLRALLRQERPDIVHAIALKPIGLLALSNHRDAGRVLAITGRGFLGVGASPLAAAANWQLRRSIRDALDQERTVLMVENEADRAWVEAARPLPDARVALMPGAGVDPDLLRPAPEPAAPIVVGVASRLVRSRGSISPLPRLKRCVRASADISLRIAEPSTPTIPSM
ncbi:MAG: glycosyltransferase [Hyphomonadaceae bacterium]